MDNNGGPSKKKEQNNRVQEGQTESKKSQTHNTSSKKNTQEKGEQTTKSHHDARVNYLYAIESDEITHKQVRSAFSTPRESIAKYTVDNSQFLDFDDLLPMIGEFGIFQKLLFILMIPFCFIAAFVYLGQIFMTLAPNNYYCFVSELSLVDDVQLRKKLSIPIENDGSYSKCLIYDTNYTAIHFAKNPSSYINTSLPTKPCKNGYVFDSEEMSFITATMEFGWVCDNDRYATYAQMIFFLGSIIGSLCYGHFADHCGRIAALVSSCFLALVGSLFTSLSNNFAGFAITRFFVGASYDTCFTMIYILILEYVGPSYRTFVANMSLALFYSPFTMVMPWFALFTQNWRRFSIVATLPIMISLFSYCVLPESARWLVSVGHIDDAIKILKRVSKCNNRPLPSNVLENFKFSCQQFYKEEIEGRHFTVRSIFKRSRMGRYMILMIVIWMTMSLLYDGHVRAASVLDKGNVFLIFCVACATELPGNILVILTLDRFGRRWCAFVYTSMSGIFSLVGASLTNPMHMLIAALAGRFCANICYNIGLQWAAEVLPTVVRAQGISLIHTMGFVAMLMSPPVIYLSHVSLSLMLYILGGLGIVGGILALFLPETLNHELPQTLSDGDDFGRDQRMWHMPCCGPGSKHIRKSRRLWHQGSSLRSISREEFRSRKLHRKARTRVHSIPSSPYRPSSNWERFPPTSQSQDSFQAEKEKVQELYKYTERS